MTAALGFFIALAAPQNLFASPDPAAERPPIGRKTFRLGPDGDIPLAAPAAWGRRVSAQNTIAALASDQALAGAAALPRFALPDLTPPPTAQTDGARLDAAADVDKAAIAALEQSAADVRLDPDLAQRLGYAFPEGRDRLEEGGAQAKKELQCLAEAIYFEARGESLEGQVAVAEVVLNRVESAYWPSSVCGVVNQGAERRNACQFSYTCDGKPEHVDPGPAWRQATQIARFLLQGAPRRMTGRATHYHADYVAPDWAKTMEKTAVIGRHIFYRRLLRITVQ